MLGVAKQQATTSVAPEQVCDIWDDHQEARSECERSSTWIKKLVSLTRAGTQTSKAHFIHIPATASAVQPRVKSMLSGVKIEPDRVFNLGVVDRGCARGL